MSATEPTTHVSRWLTEPVGACPPVAVILARIDPSSSSRQTRTTQTPSLSSSVIRVASFLAREPGDC